MTKKADGRLLLKERPRVTFDDLLERYCSLVFSRCGNITEAARRLGKHRRTIQSRIRDELVDVFRSFGSR